jgi:hypothetical protein
MDTPRKRFVAAAVLFLAWALSLAILAAGSARLPRRSAEVPQATVPSIR